MRLKDGKLSIRRAHVDDADQLYNWWNDENVMSHAGFPNGLGISRQEIIKQIEASNDNNCLLIIEVDNISVGEMNYKTIGEKTANIGIKICNSGEQGKGYGQRFLKLLIKYLFDDLGYNQIALDTNLKNTRAQHVYEKVGFKKIRIRKNSWLNQLGESQSSVEYELIKEK